MDMFPGARPGLVVAVAARERVSHVIAQRRIQLCSSRRPRAVQWPLGTLPVVLSARISRKAVRSLAICFATELLLGRRVIQLVSDRRPGLTA